MQIERNAASNNNNNEKKQPKKETDIWNKTINFLICQIEMKEA